MRGRFDDHAETMNQRGAAQPPVRISTTCGTPKLFVAAAFN